MQKPIRSLGEWQAITYDKAIAKWTKFYRNAVLMVCACFIIAATAAFGNYLTVTKLFTLLTIIWIIAAICASVRYTYWRNLRNSINV